MYILVLSYSLYCKLLMLLHFVHNLLLFLILLFLHPNHNTDPAFAKALKDAADAGVHILAMDCAVAEDTMEIRLPVLVKL